MKKILRIALALFLLLALLSGAAAESVPEKTFVKVQRNHILTGKLDGPRKISLRGHGPEVTLSWKEDTSPSCEGYLIYECKRVKSKPLNTPYGWYTKMKDGFYWYPYRVVRETKETSVKMALKTKGPHYFAVRSYYTVSSKTYVSKHGEFKHYKVSNIVGSPHLTELRQMDKNEVRVTWTAGTNAKSYEVYRRKGATGKFKKIGTTTKLKFTDKKAKQGNSYMYQIRAVNGKDTADSNIWTITTGKKPTSLKIDYAHGSIHLSWKPYGRYKEYDVFQCKTGDNGRYTKIMTVSETEVYFFTTGIGKYSYYVTPHDKISYARFSNIASCYISAEDLSHYRALIVANKYSGKSQLDGTFNDARALRGALLGLKQSWMVNVVQDANADRILSAITETFSGTTSEDVCLFYFSGHGVTAEGSNSGALVGNGSPKTYVTPAQLANALSSACGGQVIVLLDSCGSGAAIDNSVRNESPEAFLQAVNRAFSARNKSVTNKYGELIGNKFNVLAAASTGHVSREVYLNGYYCGAFTYALLQAMGASYPDGAFESAMPGDTDSDRKLTLSEAYFSIMDTIEGIRSNSDWGENDQHTRMRGNRMFVLFERKK